MGWPRRWIPSKRDRPARESVPGRAREDHLIREERLEPNSTMASRGTDDAQLELTRGDTFDDGVSVRHREEHPHIRVLSLELRERDRNRDRCRAGRGTEHEIASERSLARCGNVGDELVLEGEHALRAAIEAPAGLRWLDPAARAVQELRPEPLLESAHLQRDRGLGDTEAVGGL